MSQETLSDSKLVCGVFALILFSLMISSFSDYKPTQKLITYLILFCLALWGFCS